MCREGGGVCFRKTPSDVYGEMGDGPRTNSQIMCSGLLRELSAENPSVNVFRTIALNSGTTPTTKSFAKLLLSFKMINIYTYLKSTEKNFFKKTFFRLILVDGLRR